MPIILGIMASAAAFGAINLWVNRPSKPQPREKRVIRWTSSGPRDMRGQGLAEYGLILSLIAIIAIVVLVVLGHDVSTLLSKVGASV